jgi:MFS family permease
MTISVKKGFFWHILKDYRQIKEPARKACFNIALFAFGWGIGPDTFYSAYLKTIVDDVLVIGVLSAFFAGIKLLVNLPIGSLDGKVDERRVIRMGKILYAMSGILYFGAGAIQSVPLLLVAFVINGFANPMVFTTTQSYIRQYSSKATSCRVFGLYNAAISISFIIGSVIAAWLVKFVPLHWFYLAIPIVALLTLNTEKDLPEKHTKPILPELKKIIFKDKIYVKIIKHIKLHDGEFHFTLFILFLAGLIDYVGFIFIPILALENNLSLSQIALIFALMRVPYIMSYAFSDLADKKERNIVLGITMLMAAIMLGLLATVTSFTAIIITTAGLALALASISSVSAGLLTNLIKPSERSEITGVQEFLARGGSIVGALAFGFFAEFIGVDRTFGGLAVITAIAGMLIFTIHMKKKNTTLREVIFNKITHGWNTLRGKKGYTPDVSKV